MFYTFIVPKIRLNDICAVEDICADENAICKNRACGCQNGYYEMGDNCSELC